MIHVSDGAYNAEDFEGCFYPVQWDEEKKDFVPYETPAGFEPSANVKKEGDNLEVFLGLKADMDTEIPYELYEMIVPVYDDGEVQMVFRW